MDILKALNKAAVVLFVCLLAFFAGMGSQEEKDVIKMKVYQDEYDRLVEYRCDYSLARIDTLEAWEKLWFESECLK